MTTELEKVAEIAMKIHDADRWVYDPQMDSIKLYKDNKLIKLVAPEFVDEYRTYPNW